MLPIPWQAASPPLLLIIVGVSRGKWAYSSIKSLFSHIMFVFFPLELPLKIIAIVGTNTNTCKVGKGFTARGINPFTNKP